MIIQNLISLFINKRFKRGEFVKCKETGDVCIFISKRRDGLCLVSNRTRVQIQMIHVSELERLEEEEENAYKL